ncbi:hypothetical protein GPLA_2425 [Paraglaciecola polaris LMG 21857]|uniref:Uncharacterized protein n=1 Tax=Paraglaciecola polaris LMG 21857 TaxID=1129793 RepID=K7ADF7_9ALTE|nr:hypothetical protein GPLA_2425 [Paraglaciecola polaris LMG 21857]
MLLFNNKLTVKGAKFIFLASFNYKKTIKGTVSEYLAEPMRPEPSKL